MKTIPTLMLLACLAAQAQDQTTNAPPPPPPAPAGQNIGADLFRSNALRRLPPERLAAMSNRLARLMEATNVSPAEAAEGVPAPAPSSPAPPPTAAAPATIAPGIPAPPATNVPQTVPVPLGQPVTVPAAVTPPPVLPAPAAAAGAPATPARPSPAAAPPGFPPAGPAAAPPVPAVVPAGDVAPGFAKMAIPMDDIATNSVDFPAVDLNTFLKFYGEFIGKTILRPTVLPGQTITLKTQTPLTRKEMIQAFDTVLSMNQISTIPQGDKFVKVVQEGFAIKEAAAFSKVSMGALPEAAQYLTHLVQLKYVKPSEIVPVLTPFAKIPNSVLPVEGSQMLVIRDYAENVKRMLELIEKVDISIPSEFISEVIPIKYAMAQEIASALSSLSSGGGAATIGGGAAGGQGGMGMRSGMGTGFGGGTRSGFGARGGAGGLGGGGYQGMQTPGMPGAGGATPFGAAVPGAAGAGGSFSDRLRGILRQAGAGGTGDFQIIGMNKIVADERTNSLLVFASREDMKIIKDIIAKLDVVLAQVIIEALILEVTLTDSLNYGVSWLQQPKTSGKFSHYTGINLPRQDPLNMFGGAGTNATDSFPSGLSWFGKYNNDFNVAVQAAASDSRVNVISRPRIQTSHAVPATMTIGTSQPVLTGSYSYYGGPQQQFQYQNFGITLNVLPLINPDGLVVMDIDQQIQSNVGSVDVGSGLKQPILANRSANAKVAIRTGETVMLGGFISSSVNNTASGVPVLKDIPILGALFRSSSKSHDRTELIVLIRPTVLQSPQIAARAAIEEQEKMPLVKRAQKEDEDLQEKLSRKADKKSKAVYIDPPETK